MSNVAVVGTTSWGTTLAILLAQKGLSVSLWARTEDEANELTTAREHRHRLPGIPFPAQLQVTASPPDALRDAELVLFAVPSQTMRRNAQCVAPHLSAASLVVSATKGLEVGSSLRMSEVLASELHRPAGDGVCVLSGPNISREIVQGLPAATVVAAADLTMADRVRDLMMTPRFRVYSTTDIAGVELGGTLKNIVAMGAGMNDGWGYGANSKAAYMTRGLAEMTRLGVAAGAHPMTFQGLAGLGDLVATCTSPYSRNRRLGEAMARGLTLEQALATLGGVAEGPTTTLAARALAQRLGVEMPITEVSYRVLYQGLNPRAAIGALMEREAKHELEGLDRES